MDGHEADLVGILVVVLVLGGEQEYLLQKLVEGPHGKALRALLILTVLFDFGKLGLLFAELFHAVQQLLDILDAVGVLGVVVVAEQGDDAAIVDNLFGEVVSIHGGEHSGETLNHHNKLAHLLQGAAVDAEAKGGDVLQHGPDRHIVVGSGHAHAVQRGLADASGRIVDDAEQGLLVIIVDH